MKKILFLATILCLVGAQAQAADVQFGGEFRFRSFYTNNLTDANSNKVRIFPGPDQILGNSDDITRKDQEVFNDTRFRLKIMAHQGLATGVVLVDFIDGTDPAYDQSVATLNTTSSINGTGDRRLGSNGFGGSVQGITLREGYLRVSWPSANLIVGRQGVRLGQGLVLDDTADALTIAIPMGWASLTFMQIFLDAESRGSQNTSAYLVNLNLVPSSRMSSSLFLVYLNDRGPNLELKSCIAGAESGCTEIDFETDLLANQATLAALGWSLDYRRTTLRWITELDYLKGSVGTPNSAGREIRLRGVNAMSRLEWSWRGWGAELTGLYATGQDGDDLPSNGGHRLNVNAISPNFVLGNILVNNETLSDRDGGDIGGLNAVRIGLSWNMIGNIRSELVGIWARMTEEPAKNASRYLGFELDLNTYWPLDSNLDLIGEAGVLFPGEAWKAIMVDPEAEDLMLKFTTKLIYRF